MKTRFRFYTTDWVRVSLPNKLSLCAIILCTKQLISCPHIGLIIVFIQNFHLKDLTASVFYWLPLFILLLVLFMLFLWLREASHNQLRGLKINKTVVTIVIWKLLLLIAQTNEAFEAFDSEMEEDLTVFLLSLRIRPIISEWTLIAFTKGKKLYHSISGILMVHFGTSRWQVFAEDCKIHKQKRFSSINVFN